MNYELHNSLLDEKRDDGDGDDYLFCMQLYMQCELGTTCAELTLTPLLIRCVSNSSSVLARCTFTCAVETAKVCRSLRGHKYLIPEVPEQTLCGD